MLISMTAQNNLNDPTKTSAELHILCTLSCSVKHQLNLVGVDT